MWEPIRKNHVNDIKPNTVELYVKQYQICFKCSIMGLGSFLHVYPTIDNNVISELGGR